MTMLELISFLKNSSNLARLLDDLVVHITSRNLSPMRLMQLYSGKLIDGDKLTECYSSLINLVQLQVNQTNLEDTKCIELGDEYESLRTALWFCKNKESNKIDSIEFTKWLIAISLESHMPDIDQYVESLGDTRLLDDLGLSYDDNILFDISNVDYELRKHGLILSNDKMIYPHEFMRRYYRANFVDLLTILNNYLKDGLNVKLRIDPLRLDAHPRYYQNIFEADYWHGKPFTSSILSNTDKKELVTIHRTDEQFDISYPVRFTVFRTSMIDKNKRQFMVEEYSPRFHPNYPKRKSPGFGNRYCIQKFAHFVFDQHMSQFTHIDGSVRTFEIAEYETIMTTMTKGRDPGSKIGKRHKLFLVEGLMRDSQVYGLIYEFFRYNPHIEEYFRAN